MLNSPLSRSLGWAILVGVSLSAVVSTDVRGDETALALHRWAGTALLGEPAAAPPDPKGLDVRRQDHGEFQVRQSVLKTPLRIGNQAYGHGLGTHAVSEIVVRLGRPARHFTADVGVDNNHDTGGQRGTVLFAVEVGGKEAWRSELCRGGQAPQSARIDLGGAREFTLRVLDGGDGLIWDQADWADAAVTYEDGTRIWLDEMPVISPSAVLNGELPFSFVLGGKPSARLLPAWKKTQVARPATRGRASTVVTWTDPDSRLAVAREVTRFADHPAVEWVLRLANGGSADTPIIEGVRALDLRITLPAKGDATLHHAHGSTCAPTDFLPIRDSISPNAGLTFAPNGGRSSDGHMPFCSVQ